MNIENPSKVKVAAIPATAIAGVDVGEEIIAKLLWTRADCGIRQRPALIESFLHQPDFSETGPTKRCRSTP